MALIQVNPVIQPVVQPVQTIMTVPQPQPIMLLPPPLPMFGPHSIQMTCTNCRQFVHTRTKRSVNSTGWIYAGVLCLLLPGCCWIPICMESCQNTSHTCSNCRCLLGIHRG